MKRINYLIVLIISLILLIPNVYADNEVTFTHEQQNVINDNGELVGVELTFNLNGNDVVAIQHDMEFDSDKLELKEIIANGSFTLTYGDIEKHGSKSKTTIVVDGDYAYSTAPYFKVYFEFTDKFLPNSTALIRFTNVRAAGLGEKLIKMNGKELSLTSTGKNMLNVSATDIDEKFTIKEWIQKNKKYLYISGIVVIVLIILDIIHVSFKNRKQITPFNTNAQFKDNSAKHLRNTFTDTVENENKANGIDPDSYKYKSIILFMIGLSIISISTVFAVQGAKNQDIRDYIVGRKVDTSFSELDISGDGIVDVLDLVLEKCVKNYEIIKINEFNTEFRRNMTLYYIDLYHNQIPLEVYSIEKEKVQHMSITTIYDVNAMECEKGKIENFKKIDNNTSWTYEYDYTLLEDNDNCYMQSILGN